MIHHLYRHFDAENRLLYVGISLSTLQRLGQHKSNSEWFRLISVVKIEEFPDIEKAKKAERDAIKKEKPLYNIAHKEIIKEKKESIKKQLDYDLLDKNRLLIGAIIKKHGGGTQLANKLGVSRAVISSWKARGVIPAWVSLAHKKMFHGVKIFVDVVK